jgi:hypothetical protein
MPITEEETNKAQFRLTYEELFHQGNLAIADELIAPDCIVYVEYVADQLGEPDYLSALHALQQAAGEGS